MDGDPHIVQAINAINLIRLNESVSKDRTSSWRPRNASANEQSTMEVRKSLPVRLHLSKRRRQGRIAWGTSCSAGPSTYAAPSLHPESYQIIFIPPPFSKLHAHHDFATTHTAPRDE